MNVNKTNIKRMLTRKKLQAWLDAEDTTAKIELVCSNPFSCAVSQYLNTVFEIDVRYGHCGFGTAGDIEYKDEHCPRECFYLPDWARAFIQLFDRGGVWGELGRTKTFQEAAEDLRNL